MRIYEEGKEHIRRKLEEVHLWSSLNIAFEYTLHIPFLIVHKFSRLRVETGDTNNRRVNTLFGGRMPFGSVDSVRQVHHLLVLVVSVGRQDGLKATLEVYDPVTCVAKLPSDYLLHLA